MREMVTYGPSKYDLVSVYESVAIQYADNAQSRYGSLQVIYPPTTLLSDHPFCVLNGDWMTTQKREAGQAFLRYLVSRPAQLKALTYGFRPVDPGISIADASSPLVKYQTVGIRTDLPPLAEVPAGDVLTTLLDLWQRSSKR